jgi:hypothetical protein
MVVSPEGLSRRSGGGIVPQARQKDIRLRERFNLPDFESCIGARKVLYDDFAVPVMRTSLRASLEFLSLLLRSYMFNFMVLLVNLLLVQANNLLILGVVDGLRTHSACS